MFRSKTTSNEVVEGLKREIHDIKGGYVCSSCKTRKYQIEQTDYRGVVLNAIDITMCIPATPNTTEHLRAIQSVKTQILQPVRTWAFLNEHAWTRVQVLEYMLNRVETPYVAFMNEHDILKANHLFLLSNEITRTDADIVYSCGCSGECTDEAYCRRTYLARTRAIKHNAKSAIRVGLEESTWVKVEPANV